jgi:hypothetical protein
MSASGISRSGMAGAVGVVILVNVAVVDEVVVDEVEEVVVVPVVPVLVEVVRDVDDDVESVEVVKVVGVVALPQLANTNKAAVIKLIPCTSLTSFIVLYFISSTHISISDYFVLSLSFICLNEQPLLIPIYAWYLNSVNKPRYHLKKCNNNVILYRCVLSL